jgi:DNA-binding HxlR family transcriptional regulator
MNQPTLNLPEENSCGCADTDSGASIECMCTATGLVQIIGRKYALRLLTVIGEKQQIRFNDLKTVMNDMSSSTLAIRLSELERAALIERRTFHETPPRVEYNLTTEGRKLRQSLFTLSKYASRKPSVVNGFAE